MSRDLFIPAQNPDITSAQLVEQFRVLVYRRDVDAFNALPQAELIQFIQANSGPGSADFSLQTPATLGTVTFDQRYAHGSVNTPITNTTITINFTGAQRGLFSFLYVNAASINFNFVNPPSGTGRRIGSSNNAFSSSVTNQIYIEYLSDDVVNIIITPIVFV